MAASAGDPLTTIAYKDGVIAYDSRACMGDLIVDDDYDKHFEVKGVHFFMCGSTAENGHFISGYFGEDHDREVEAWGFVVDDGEVYYCGISEKGLSRDYLAPDRVFAIGSGCHFAYAAMDLGCSAKEAIQAAAKRDTGTGGKVRTFRV